MIALSSEYLPLFLPRVMAKFEELDDADLRLIPVCEVTLVRNPTILFMISFPHINVHLCPF